MAAILIVHASGEGQTLRIAERMAEQMRRRGHAVTLAPCRRFSPPPSPAGFDAVLVGSSVHMGNHAQSAERFVTTHIGYLERLPSAFFSVSLSAASPRPEVRAAAKGYLDDFLKETGWRPRYTAIFAGALRYSRYTPLKRWIVARVSVEEGWASEDPRDHEYTDWPWVRAGRGWPGPRTAPG